MSAGSSQAYRDAKAEYEFLLPFVKGEGEEKTRDYPQKSHDNGSTPSLSPQARAFYIKSQSFLIKP
ncbi:hypothetical protein QUB06_34210 [Microcoleus sp. D2_18a_D3]